MHDMLQRRKTPVKPSCARPTLLNHESTFPLYTAYMPKDLSPSEKPHEDKLHKVGVEE